MGRPMDLPRYYNRIGARGWTHAGYVWISTPDRGEIMQHRYFMEKHLGRILDVDEIVHHKNGDKLDNRLDNLELMNRAKHTSHHRVHRVPCMLCSRDDPHGAHGLCAKHYQHVNYFVKRFDIKVPRNRMAMLHFYVGLAWAINNDNVQLAIQKVLDGAHA